MRARRRKGADGYSPAHITAFFTIHPGRTPAETGSTGAGICLEGGVSTMLVTEPSERMELRMTSNGSRFQSPTCESLFRRLITGKEPAIVTANQESIFPANYGYGISAASALSLGLAINRIMDLGLTREDVGVQAHIAEVENMTGLGDVSAELVGGFVLRDMPGAPGIGRAIRLGDGEGVAVISSPVKTFPTRPMITENEYVERINSKGKEALNSFSTAKDLDNLMIISRHFWENVGLMDDEMLGIMKRFERAGVPNPSVKKGVVFGLVPVDRIPKVVAAITDQAPSRIKRSLPAKIRDPQSGRSLIVSRISRGGAC